MLDAPLAAFSSSSFFIGGKFAADMVVTVEGRSEPGR